MAAALDHYLEQAPRWLRMVERDVVTGDGSGSAAAAALAAASRAIGAHELSRLADRLADGLRREDPGAASDLAMAQDGLRAVTETIHERRAAGWLEEPPG